MIYCKFFCHLNLLTIYVSYLFSKYFDNIFKFISNSIVYLD